jgi:hypothetical protein
VTDRNAAADRAVQDVVQSYTQAELALAEVKTAITRFTAASEQLSAAEAGSEAAAQAMRTAAAASDGVAKELEHVVERLGDTVTALKAVDPDRLWKHVEWTEKWHQAVEATRVADHKQSMASTEAAAASRVADHKQSMASTEAAAEVLGRIERRANQALRIGILSGIGVVTAVVLLVIVVARVS